MDKIIDGKAVAARIKDEIRDEIKERHLRKP